MKIFQKLEIDLTGTTKEDVIAKIDEVLPPSWIRDSQVENDLFKDATGTDKQYAYKPKVEGLEKATLWIAQNCEGNLYVSNIVPIEKMQLSKSEYNGILQAFYEIVKEYPDIKCKATDSEINAEVFLSSNVYGKLKRFSDCANKSTGYHHPCDYERWLKFVVSYYEAAKEKDNLNNQYDKVEGFLHEEMGWTEELARKLSSQLFYSIDTLKRYDEIGNRNA